ncbi:hypothetical protein NDN08_003633 [Rhodosorus marinus]|uniref:Uncharacterized protein n=1 Tax=Rhodosorus marinus TaxID=101924 RepID=A0AAV8V317_9RHOD|nr:hypothetical protein NDN08_003633 [Rhodosorus marinus]
MEHEPTGRGHVYEVPENERPYHQMRTSALPSSPVSPALPSNKSVQRVPPVPSVGSPSCRCYDVCNRHPSCFDRNGYYQDCCSKRKGSLCSWNNSGPMRKAPRGRIVVMRDEAPRGGYQVECEYCSSVHDGTYGSGRFCSVHCARRVAASRKWEKQRDAKKLKASIKHERMFEIEKLGVGHDLPHAGDVTKSSYMEIVDALLTLSQEVS